MKYCAKCGKLMEDREAYCNNCSAPANGACHPTYRPVNPNVIDPDLQYPSPLCKLAAGITGIVYGLGLLGGGVCCIHSVGVILRLSAQEKHISHVDKSIMEVLLPV